MSRGTFEYGATRARVANEGFSANSLSRFRIRMANGRGAFFRDFDFDGPKGKKAPGSHGRRRRGR